MTHASQMLQTHPRASQFDTEALTRTIEALADCAQACASCSDACLAEEHVKDLIRCIRLNLDCADICTATASMLSRMTDPQWSLLRRQVEVCVEACRMCAEECERHASQHEHCRVCAEACRACEQACQQLLQTAMASAGRM
jgi:hypothetical protein